MMMMMMMVMMMRIMLIMMHDDGDGDADSDNLFHTNKFQTRESLKGAKSSLLYSSLPS